MRRNNYLILSCILLLITFKTFSIEVGAPLIVLEERNPIFPIGDKISFFEDESAKLTFKEVATKDIVFKQSTSENPGHGITSSAYWFKFKAKNSTNDKWYLQVVAPNSTIIDLYIISKDGKVDHLNQSMESLFSERTIKTNQLIFNLNLNQNEEKTYYLRIVGENSLKLSFTVGTMPALYENNHISDVANSMHLGLILALCLYNLFVFISLKDKAYLYYVLYMLFFGLNVSIVRGYFQEFISPNHPWLNDTNIYGGLSFIFAILFTNSFLMVKQLAPKWKALSTVFLILGFSIILFTLVGQRRLGFIMLVLTSILVVPYVTVMGLTTLRRGFSPARYYLIGFSILAIGLSVFILKDFDILPYNIFTNISFQLGAGIEAIVLSFALANKLYTYKQEKEKAQELALEQAKGFSKKLIQSQEDERKRIARELHDSVGQSLSVIKNKLSLLKKPFEKPEQVYEAAEGIKEIVSHTIQEVRGISYALRPVQLDLLGLSQALKTLAEEVAASGEIDFIIHIDPLNELFPKESEISVYRIVQECLNNILKHSQAKEASLRIAHLDDTVKFFIEDKGIGISKGKDPKSFGLFGIRERVAALGGSFKIDKNFPQGTKMEISLPIN